MGAVVFVPAPRCPLAPYEPPLARQPWPPLRAWRRTQAADRLLIGASWQDANGLVVTVADGSAPNPEAFSNLFHKLAKRARLPPIRLHDLRHSYATRSARSRCPGEVLSQRVGHADVGVTLKVYAHVTPGDDEEAALRADALLAEP